MDKNQQHGYSMKEKTDSNCWICSLLILAVIWRLRSSILVRCRIEYWFFPTVLLSSHLTVSPPTSAEGTSKNPLTDAKEFQACLSWKFQSLFSLTHFSTSKCRLWAALKMVTFISQNWALLCYCFCYSDTHQSQCPETLPGLTLFSGSPHPRILSRNFSLLISRNLRWDPTEKTLHQFTSAISRLDTEPPRAAEVWAFILKYKFPHFLVLAGITQSLTINGICILVPFYLNPYALNLFYFSRLW